MVITRICPATDIVCNNPLCGPTVCAIASARFFTPPPISGDVETMTPEQAVEVAIGSETTLGFRGYQYTGLKAGDRPIFVRGATQLADFLKHPDIAALSLPAVPVDREVLELIRTAHDAINAITLARRDIGPLATQAQTAGHALAKASAILALRRPPPEASLGGEWQDIATAPKDGTDFLALIPWQRKHHQMAGCFAPDGKFHSWPGRNQYEPTHWRPLPAPPALNGGGK